METNVVGAESSCCYSVAARIDAKGKASSAEAGTKKAIEKDYKNSKD
jgi:hypothetical protein